jgi:uncharacterized protein YkwD
MPIGIAIAVALLVAVASPGTVLGWDNYSFSSASETEMLTLINQARAANGLPALNMNTNLKAVARWRSKDMYDRNYFSHSIPNPPGGRVFDELHRRGICYTVAGENIGVNNYPDDVATQTLFNGWMNSSGHRALILSNDFTRVGIGAFKGTGSDYPKHLWTAVFTHPCSSSTPKPTPRPTPKPTPRPTHHTTTPTPPPADKATSGPAPEATPEPTPEATPDPVEWLDFKQGDASDDGDPSGPSASAEPGTDGQPTPGDVVVGGDGVLQVYEPPPATGLLDAIVGDVVAPFLGK